MRKPDAVTALAALLIALLPVSSRAARPPDWEIQTISPQALEREWLRMKREEHLPDDGPTAKQLRGLLKYAPASGKIQLSQQVIAILVGNRMGGPDPWADIAPTEIRGRTVKAVGIHFDAPELEDKEEEKKLIEKLCAISTSPYWQPKILDFHPAQTGLMVVVPPADVPAMEHALSLAGDRHQSQISRGHIGLHEGPPDVIYQRYIAPLPELPQAIPVQWIMGNPAVYQDQRVTIAGYTSHPFEDTPHVSDGGPGGKDIKLQLSSKRPPEGDEIFAPWPILFASGHRGDFEDLGLNSKDAKDFRESGRPTLVTGVVRVTTERTGLYANTVFKDMPSEAEQQRRLADDGRSIPMKEIKALRLEVESIRETTTQDPSWQRVIDQGRKYVLPSPQ
jgi:hypothetical protein